MVCVSVFVSFSLWARGIQGFFFFLIGLYRNAIRHIPPLISLLLGLCFSWPLQGPGFLWSCLSPLHLGTQRTHFILVKISLNRFIADCCSCNQCLQSDGELEIKACHHYLINLKLSSFWSCSVPFHTPERAANTVPGVLTDSGWRPWEAGPGLAATLKSSTI